MTNFEGEIFFRENSLVSIIGSLRYADYGLRLRTTATVKHATAHDQNNVTVHFSRVVLRLR